MPTIEIEITSAGVSQVQTQGFIGSSCRAASEFLEQALGKVTHEEVTTEFHWTEAAHTTSQLRQL